MSCHEYRRCLVGQIYTWSLLFIAAWTAVAAVVTH
jgi:hypothetical protein